MGGLSGRLFREFGMTIAGAVLISAVVALTLTPMLASRLLQGAATARGWLFAQDRAVLRARSSAATARRSQRFLRRRWRRSSLLARGRR